MTVGLDVSDRTTEAFAIDHTGGRTERFRFRTRRSELVEALRRFAGARVVLEVGAHSPWMSRALQDTGCEVIVANPRRVRLIAEADTKSDRCDAEQLARLGRIDVQLLAPITHRSEEGQRDLARIRARDGLVRARTLLINQLRGTAKSLGMRLPSCSADAFAKRLGQPDRGERLPGEDAVRQVIETLTREIRQLTREIEQRGATRYPATQLLRQIAGVGPITALTYVLTIEDPRRFPRSRSVGAYLGLRPRQRDSGQQRPQLRITKAGDPLLRRLLVNAAQYMLGPFGPDSDLRRFGSRLAERGGKGAKRRAVVAVARKLAVLLHRLWSSGEVYDPLRSSA
jgi:transposase